MEISNHAIPFGFKGVLLFNFLLVSDGGKATVDQHVGPGDKV